MYIPTSFREDNRDTLLAFMRTHSFATVVSVIDGVPFASHIPVSVEEHGESVVLTGHVAKSNPHVQAFSHAEVTPTLAVFTGPHAYVSPTVYESRESVPTWNYIAVHAIGIPRPVTYAESPELMKRMLERMIQEYDPAYMGQWNDLTPKFRDGMMRGVVAFEMPVTSIEGKYKLSQNRSAHDQAAVAALFEAGADSGARAVAAEMRNRG